VDRQKALTEARSLERGGNHQAAIRAYIHAGHAMDASRLLANIGRFGDAGDLLLKALKLSPTEVGTLTGPRRGAALKAAVCYARAGRLTDAATIVLALGARESVVGTLIEVGDQEAAKGLLRQSARPDQPTLTLEDAARTRGQELIRAEQHADALRLFRIAGDPIETSSVLWEQGAHGDAIALLLDHELWLDAARFQLEGGDHGSAMASLSRIKPSNPHFRQACCSLIQMVHDHELSPSLLDEPVILRMAEWDKAAPANLAELQALYLWARLLEVSGERTRAVALLSRVRERRPGHADVTQRLQRLSSEGEIPPVMVPLFMGTDLSSMLDTESAFSGDAPADAASPRAAAPKKPVAAQPAPEPADHVVQVTPTSGTAQTISIDGLGGGIHSAVAAGAEGPDDATEGIRPGILVEGRYEIKRHLGDGATARVFEAIDNDLRDPIAMKFFHLMVSRDETMTERMTLELRLCRRLTHRNIIKIFDIGSFGGHRFLTMELLVGQTLEQLLEEAVDTDLALDILTQACRGLQEAHSHDFVHRDVKPDNLFLTSKGVVKVMDFGIAKQTTAEGMTLTGTILGTPGYMAPEQIDGSSPVSQAADQYAIGALAYRLFTGTMVFQHEDMMPLMMMHVTERPELPSRRRPGLSPEIDMVVMRLLSKKPADRFPSCAKVANAFEALRSAR